MEEEREEPGVLLGNKSFSSLFSLWQEAVQRISPPSSIFPGVSVCVSVIESKGHLLNYLFTEGEWSVERRINPGEKKEEKDKRNETRDRL